MQSLLRGGARMRYWRLGLAFFLPMFAEPAFADPPLPAGKPAGARAAQINTGGAFFITAAAVVAVVGLVISNHPYKVPGQSSTTSTGH